MLCIWQVNCSFIHTTSSLPLAVKAGPTSSWHSFLGIVGLGLSVYVSQSCDQLWRVSMDLAWVQGIVMDLWSTCCVYMKICIDVCWILQFSVTTMCWCIVTNALQQTNILLTTSFGAVALRNLVLQSCIFMFSVGMTSAMDVGLQLQYAKLAVL